MTDAVNHKILEEAVPELSYKESDVNFTNFKIPQNKFKLNYSLSISQEYFLCINVPRVSLNCLNMDMLKKHRQNCEHIPTVFLSSYLFLFIIPHEKINRCLNDTNRCLTNTLN